jgi:hypothetical protein
MLKNQHSLLSKVGMTQNQYDLLSKLFNEKDLGENETLIKLKAHFPSSFNIARCITFEKASCVIDKIIKLPNKQQAYKASDDFRYDNTPIPQVDEEIVAKYNNKTEPFGFKLYNHQIYGLEKLKGKKYQLLNSGLGSGKSFHCIYEMIFSDMPMLLLCKSGLLDGTWKRFIKNYTSREIIDLRDTQKDKSFPRLEKGQIGICNQEFIWRRDSSCLLKSENLSLIIDEISDLGGLTNGTISAKQSKWLLKNQNSFSKITMLSGSITDGKPNKLLFVLKMLGVKITYKEFCDSFCKMFMIKTKWGTQIPQISGFKNKKALIDFMNENGQLIIRTEQIGNKLPPEIDTYIDCEKTKELIQLEKYKPVKMPYKWADKTYTWQLEKDISSVPDGKSIKWVSEKNKLIKFNNELKLKYFAGAFNKHKTDALIDLLSEMENKRVIIFYTYEMEKGAIIKAIETSDKNRKYFEFSGKKKELDGFMDAENSILLAQSHTASKGLNLQITNIIIYFSPFDEDQYIQSRARIRRLDTTFSNCIYYKLSTKNSKDARLWKKLDQSVRASKIKEQ